MKRMPCLLAIMAIGLTATSTALAEDHSTAKKLFKDAFYQQTVEGDTAQAIGLYQKGLTKPDLPAKMAATAYYQLGLCYEKQDKRTPAKECYQKIIDQYPDEKENVAKAKKKLSTLFPKKRGGYIAYLDNLPVDRLDIKDPKVTRQYIKKKFGTPQFEHGFGYFINYGGKYGLRFDMKGNRVREICLFQTFPGEIQKVNAQGETTTLPPLKKDLVSSKIELRKGKAKQYAAYYEKFPLAHLDIKDPKVTRQFIKEKFGPPQFEHPGGLFLNYGQKYGLRFDMNGDRVRSVCLFKTFPGTVVCADDAGGSKLSPLQGDLVVKQIVLIGSKEPASAIVVNKAGEPIADAKIQMCYVPKVQPSDMFTITAGGPCGISTSADGRFSLLSIKDQILMFLECEHEHYATKMVAFPLSDDPKYEKMMAGEVPIADGVCFKEGRLKIIMDKGASLRGTAKVVLPDGETIPAAGYQIGLASKGKGGTKTTVKNRDGKFFFDGILEMESIGISNKTEPAVWELSCKREDAPNSEWVTKEFTFERGEQAVAEIVIKYEPGTAKFKTTITRLPSEKTDDKK